ncbi:MAG: DUF1465 family protein [Rhodothalassiaceae bacterium]
MNPTARLDAIEKTHREALALAEQARSYIAWQRSLPQHAVPLEGQPTYAAESLRMSTRIIHVVAWTLAQKAVAAGEITREDARGTEYCFGGERVCLAEPVGDLDLLPAAMQEMIARSERLYRRVQRLDGMLDSAADKAAAASSPPVHGLWQQLDDRLKN